MGEMKSGKVIDINCDMGEGTGIEPSETDCQLMELISSVNIACGAHAGNLELMAATVRLAKQNGVAIGAHPGYADRQNFGRRELTLSPEEIEALITLQVSALVKITQEQKTDLVHVKPHGALYNQAAREIEIARAIASAVKLFSPNLILVGLAGSHLVEAGVEVGLPTANEGFPERAYEPDGSLRNRSLPGALISDPQEAAEQGLRLAEEGVPGSDGKMRVGTLCIHGDSPGAPRIAKVLRRYLEENGFKIRRL